MSTVDMNQCPSNLAEDSYIYLWLLIVLARDPASS